MLPVGLLVDQLGHLPPLGSFERAICHELGTEETAAEAGAAWLRLRWEPLLSALLTLAWVELSLRRRS